MLIEEDRVLQLPTTERQDGTLILREIVIVASASNHNPTILNPDFLRTNEIVPPEWELLEPPLCIAPLAQVRYKNGFTVQAQPERIIFVQRLERDDDEIICPRIAYKYLATLPHVGYEAIGHNPKGQVLFSNEADAVHFTLDTLVAPGPWKNFEGVSPSRAFVRLAYPLKGVLLTLSVDQEGPTAPTDGDVSKSVVFGANFHRDVKAQNAPERLSLLRSALDHWKSDLQLFRSLVNTCFMTENREVKA